MSNIEVRHDTEMTTFTAELDGAEAVLMYRPVDGKTLDFEHTYVPPEHRGRGVASVLAGAAFEYARESGYKVIPSCPYITTYLKRHPEYHDLVADE